MALIFVLSSIEITVPYVDRFPLRDKGIHFVEYAVLGWLCARAAHRTWPDQSLLRVGGFAFLVAAGWGLSDELHQAFVPGRMAEVSDWVADALGSAAGVLGSHALRRPGRKGGGSQGSTDS